MKRDKNWECYLSLSRKKYAGKFVVIAGGRLVGAGGDLSKLLRLAQKDHPKETPLVAKVRDPRKVCVYDRRLDGERQASEPALAATRLRDLNERQANEGIWRLHQDLRAQRDAGTIDAKGKRLRLGLPAQMVDPASDVV